MDYLEFFDLDVMDDVENVLPDGAGLFSSDYFSAPIFVDSGIPIGASSELKTVMHVRK